jgi:hypothetical protein
MSNHILYIGKIYRPSNFDPDNRYDPDNWPIVTIGYLSNRRMISKILASLLYPDNRYDPDIWLIVTIKPYIAKIAGGAWKIWKNPDNQQVALLLLSGSSTI